MKKLALLAVVAAGVLTGCEDSTTAPKVKTYTEHPFYSLYVLDYPADSVRCYAVNPHSSSAFGACFPYELLERNGVSPDTEPRK